MGFVLAHEDDTEKRIGHQHLSWNQIKITHSMQKLHQLFSAVIGPICLEIGERAIGNSRTLRQTRK